MVPGIEVLYREGLVFIYNGLASVACEYLVVTLTVLGDAVFDGRWSYRHWSLDGGRGSGDYGCGFDD